MTFAKDFHLNSMAVENTNIIQTRAGEIVLYQPDANTHLEVRVDDETGQFLMIVVVFFQTIAIGYKISIKKNRKKNSTCTNEIFR